MSSLATTARLRRFGGPLRDRLTVGPGATLLVAGLWPLLTLGLSPRLSAAIAYTLCLLFAFPHVARTWFEVYARRENLLEHPVPTIFLPLVLLAGAGMLLDAPTLLGPWAVLLYLAGSVVHHTQQTLALLAERARAAGQPLTRARPAAALLLGAAAAVAGWCVGPTPTSFYGIQPPMLPAAWRGAAYGLSVLALAGLAVWLFRRHRQGVSVREEALILAPQVLWYTLLAAAPALVLFVPALHGLQALGAEGAAGDREGIWRRYGLAFLLGGALFEALPGLIASAGIEVSTAYVAVTAWLQLHHFLTEPLRWRREAAR